MHRLLDKQVKDALRPDGEIDLARLLAAVESTYARDRRRAPRHRALDAAHVRRGDHADARAAREHRQPAAGRARSRQGRHRHRRRGRPHRFAQCHRPARVRSYRNGDRRDARSVSCCRSSPTSRRSRRSSNSWPRASTIPRSTSRRTRRSACIPTARTFLPSSRSARRMLNRRSLFVVCLRDTTDRKAADAALRDSEARYRTLVEHAPEIIVVVDLDRNRLADVNENAVRFFKMDRAALLTTQSRRAQSAAAARRLAVRRRESRAVRADAGRRGAGARMGVPRRARQRHSLRSALGAPAVGRSTG